MNVNECVKKFSKKNPLVSKWLKEGLIPGATEDQTTPGDWIIPNEAREPYTGRRAKTGIAIYMSICKGVNLRKHVFGRLYDMSDEEFNGFIHSLISIGLIRTIMLGGQIYYEVTPKMQEVLTLKKQANLKRLEFLLATVASAASVVGVFV